MTCVLRAVRVDDAVAKLLHGSHESFVAMAARFHLKRGAHGFALSQAQQQRAAGLGAT